MSFGGDDDRRVQRKFDAPIVKPLHHRGRGAAAEEQQALVELLEIGGAMMSIFSKRKLWREPDVSSLLMHVRIHHLI
jgi:hypothetical protein